MTTVPAILLASALVTAFVAGRLWEARDRERALQTRRLLTVRDLRRSLGSDATARPRLPISSGRIVDAALVLAGTLVLVPVLYVALHPVYVAARHPVVGKYGLRVPAYGAQEARR